MNYRAPWWLPGGHVQTVWAALRSQPVIGSAPVFERQRWTTPDGDFIDVDWLCCGPESLPAIGQGSARSPLLVLFHGLEGSSQSHYAQAMACVARQRAWRFAVPHFRGCSGQINRAPRAYHSGDHEEIEWLLQRFKAAHAGPIVAAGVSLGGNALLRWAGERGQQALGQVRAVAAICSPLDLMASGLAMGRGLNRYLYTPRFLKTMVPKALAKLDQYPGLFDRQALLRARDLYAFDDVFTAPLHGFADTADYWRRASALPLMSQIAVPTLALHACNDPFVPAASLPRPQQVSAQVTLWQPPHGGHVGFPSAAGAWPSTHVLTMPQAVTSFLAAML